MTTQTTNWLDGKTAPKDGSPFWAYLHQTGIRKLRWATSRELAEDEGGDPEDYIDGCFVECCDFSSDWTPKYWLPLNAIPEPEEV